MIRALASFSLVLLAGLFSFSALPAAASAAGQVAGWIPYWAADKGMKDAAKQLKRLDAVYLFAFTVRKDGSLNDQFGLDSRKARNFVRDARKAGVAVLPTVMWSDTNAIHEVLSSREKRAAQVREIAAMVEAGGYDGVDIDYEGKKADTKDFFSAFLVELDAALAGKTLSCTIEARTPADSLYAVVPETIRYANDLAVIGRVCDVVNVMAYDQQRADLKLNSARKGLPYYPVADPEWVEKVARHMSQTIPTEKLMLGVPTYGREVEVTVSPDWFRGYGSLWSVNPSYATSEARKQRVTPGRNAAGEMSYTYVPKHSNQRLSAVSAPEGTPAGMEAAARALAHANATGETVTFNMVWWSDAEAVAQKAALAARLGLRGVSIFKIDGGQDKGIWKIL